MAVRTAIDRSNGLTGRTVDRPVRSPDRYRTGPARNGRSPVPVPSMLYTQTASPSCDTYVPVYIETLSPSYSPCVAVYTETTLTLTLTHLQATLLFKLGISNLREHHKHLASHDWV